LRTQPENVKVTYIWVSAVVVVAIVALLWVEVFRKYERKSIDNRNKSELIKEGEKIKEDIGGQIKVPNLDIPPKQLLASPKVTPEVSLNPSPEASPETSPEPSAEAL
jgi:hypothetical protein